MLKKDFPLLENNYPQNFREDVCEQIFDNIKNCESFSFIGIRDNCKINLLRFIGLRSDIQKKYLGKKARDFYIVLVNLNELPEVTPASFYRSLNFSLSQSDKILSDNPLVLINTLKKNIEKITNTNKTIVFLFNNFNILHKLNIKTVSHNLVALRNVARYRIVFVFTGTRPFDGDEFFFNKIVWMTPFKSEDALFIVLRNMQRYKVKLTQKQIGQVISLSGGHGGLIKFIIQSIGREGPSALNIEKLYTNSDICFQCERLLAPLTPLEKSKLRANEKDDLLLKMGMQVNLHNNYVPFSPLLEHHLKEDETCLAPFCYDKENDEIYFFGKPQSHLLTSKEILLLKLLIESPTKVFKREEIMNKVWGEDEFPSDWAFDKLISRLREKLGGKYLITLRNQGLALTS